MNDMSWNSGLLTAESPLEVLTSTLPSTADLPSTTKAQGVVLAGSHAWGDCVVKEVVSQLQLPIAGRLLIDHLLDWFASGGATTTTLCANSRTRSLVRYFGEHRDSRMDLHYLEDRMPRGPAGCIGDVAGCQHGDLFVVAECGVLPLISLTELLEHHSRSNAVMTAVVGRRHEARGTVDEPGGIYVFSREALQHVPAKGYQDIKEMLIPKLHGVEARVACYEVSSHRLPRIKGATSYLAVNSRMLERALDDDAQWEDYDCQGEARIHQSAELADGVELIGPVLVQAGARIGRSAMIIGPATVGEGCVIGCDAVVSRSAMWNESCVGDRSIIDHSILTHRAIVPSGAQLNDRIGVMPPARQSGSADVTQKLSRATGMDTLEAPPVAGPGRHPGHGRSRRFVRTLSSPQHGAGRKGALVMAENAPARPTGQGQSGSQAWPG